MKRILFVFVTGAALLAIAGPAAAEGSWQSYFWSWFDNNSDYVLVRCPAINQTDGGGWMRVPADYIKVYY